MCLPVGESTNRLRGARLCAGSSARDEVCTLFKHPGAGCSPTVAGEVFEVSGGLGHLGPQDVRHSALECLVSSSKQPEKQSKAGFMLLFAWFWSCRYKELKKLLKHCSPTDGRPCPDEEEFFANLRTQLAAINRDFHVEATRTVSAYQTMNSMFYRLCCFIPRGPRQYALLADRAYWCSKYARANAVALRKILKKHDKICGDAKGREFLQECWNCNSSDAIGMFLHSPLSDELKAIQEVARLKVGAAEQYTSPKQFKDALVSQEAVDESATTPPRKPLAVPRAEDATHRTSLSRLSSGGASQSSDGLRGAAALGGSAPSVIASMSSMTSPSLKVQRRAALAAITESPSCMLDSSDIDWVVGRSGSEGSQSNNPGGDGGSSGMGLSMGMFTDEELRCPICLEIMYKPVGLGCGHKFCRTCALESVGFGNVLGAFETIANYIPARMPCPECRQTNVYKNAVSLKEMGALIRERHPELWASRVREDWDRRDKINEAASKAARERVVQLMGMSPYDLLNSF